MYRLRQRVFASAAVLVVASLLSMVTHGDGKPIGNAVPVFKDLRAELKAQTDKLQLVLTRDLAAFNAEAKRLNLKPVNEK